MALSITCPACHHAWLVPETAVGEAVTCPSCQTVLLPSTREGMDNYATRLLFAAPAREEEVYQPKAKGREVTFRCPFCDEAYRVSRKLRGRKINCRSCREPSRV
jgi:hypothetical protein